MPRKAKRAATDELDEIWAAYVKDRTSVELRNQLIEQYTPLVKYQAAAVWKRTPESVELDDLVSVGMFGLIDALQAFDPGRGVQFTTYCVARVRGAMLDELRALDWVPRLVRAKRSKLSAACEQLRVALNREPTSEELAERLGLPIADVEDMRCGAVAGVSSLNKRWYETDSYKDVRQLDLVKSDREPDPSSRPERVDLMRLVTRGLNQNERMIVILYYYEHQTMKQIGQTLDLSESRVSQMHSALISRLRVRLEPRRPEFAA